MVKMSSHSNLEGHGGATEDSQTVYNRVSLRGERASSGSFSTSVGYAVVSFITKGKTYYTKIRTTLICY